MRNAFVLKNANGSIFFEHVLVLRVTQLAPARRPARQLG